MVLFEYSFYSNIRSDLVDYSERVVAIFTLAAEERRERWKLMRCFNVDSPKSME